MQDFNEKNIEDEQASLEQFNEPSQPMLPSDTSTIRVSSRKGKMGTKKVIHANPVRLGKDEMNLIEHPFAVLWQKEADNAVISYEWEARHPKTGKLIPASWMVAGHREHGLPTSTEERVYLVLLELTREAGFTSPVVHFSRYDILQRLSWGDSHRSYMMLQTAFDRLQGVTINAKNAFWSPKSGTFRNTNFNIIDHSDTNAEPPGRKSKGQNELPLSYFKWSDVMFDSFQSGYIRTLDLDFALHLQGDIALRLYRYLDKKSYDGRAEFEIELFSLCIGHLGMKPSPYPSKLKERLKGAHEELIDKGFLSDVSYETMKSSKDVKVRYRFRPRLLSLDSPKDKAATPESQAAEESSTQLPETPPPTSDSQVASAPITSPSIRAGLEAQMKRLGVTPDTIEDFLQNVSAAELQNQLDYLDDRKPKDRAAVFVKSVREQWTPPPTYLKRISAQNRRESARTGQEAEKQKKAQEAAAKRQETALSEDDKAKLDALWDEMDDEAREPIEIETRDRLGVLFQEGKNSAAFAAMRRHVMRELQDQKSAEIS